MEAQAQAQLLTREVLAQAEKKMDMTLDEIIKMSKNKGNKTKRPQFPNKNQRTSNNTRQDKSANARWYMNSRSSLRQGVLAQRRSNFHGNQFPLANEAARRTAITPFRGMAPRRDRMANSNKTRNGFPLAKSRPRRNTESKKQEPREDGNSTPKTLDALFANLKEQRMKGFSSPKAVPRHNHNNNNGGSRKQIPPWARKLLY